MTVSALSLVSDGDLHEVGLELVLQVRARAVCATCGWVGPLQRDEGAAVVDAMRHEDLAG